MIALPGLELEIGRDVDIEVVVKALCENKKIANIRFWQLNDNEAEKLAKALRTNNMLTTLDLSVTQVSNPGPTAIGNALQTNNTLTTLYLSNTQVSDPGAIAIGNALQTNNTLTTLDLGGTHVSDPGATAIGNALQTNNTTLKTLHLPFPVNYELKKKIYEMVKRRDAEVKSF